MLLPRLHGEAVEAYVEELDRAIARGDDQLILVDFGPGEIVKRVLGIEPAPTIRRHIQGHRACDNCMSGSLRNSPLLRYYAIGREA